MYGPAAGLFVPFFHGDAYSQQQRSLFTPILTLTEQWFSKHPVDQCKTFEQTSHTHSFLFLSLPTE